jgi:hypothetical protein
MKARRIFDVSNGSEKKNFTVFPLTLFHGTGSLA